MGETTTLEGATGLAQPTTNKVLDIKLRAIILPNDEVENMITPKNKINCRPKSPLRPKLLVLGVVRTLLVVKVIKDIQGCPRHISNQDTKATSQQAQEKKFVSANIANHAKLCLL